MITTNDQLEFKTVNRFVCKLCLMLCFFKPGQQADINNQKKKYCIDYEQKFEDIA